MDGRFVSTLTLLAVLAASLLLTSGCGDEAPPPEVIVRVGDASLTRAELGEMMANIAIAQDSLDAQQQIIEQWITNELLHQEARRRGLRREPDVERLLKENERTILINALITSFHEQEIEGPSQAEIQSYYERHKDQLGLRSPYVNVRYLAASEREAAETVREILNGVESSAEADSLWPGLVRTHALDAEGSMELASNFYPEGQLLSVYPPLRDVLRQLQDGQVSPVLEFGDGYHVLQLVRRVGPGTTPELQWVEDEIRNRLIIQARKQIVARQVQRLRTEALSRNELEMP